jgi:Zn-finger nucleic acid-binding protein
MKNANLPAEMLHRVLADVKEQGFCVLGAEEIDGMIARTEGVAARRQFLEEFARLSGLRMETTPDLNAARFENPLAENTMKLTLHSPISGAVMHLHEIEPGLLAYGCPTSGGVWIPLQSYLAWKEHPTQDASEAPVSELPSVSDDSKQRALICPESGHLLIRYKVGHGLPFHVDMSPKTGGVWLDRGEWDALKSKRLHRDPTHIFTAPYQRQIRTEEHEEIVERLLREKIGSEDFAKAAEFKRWLSLHPQREQSCSYLLHELETVP